MSRQAVWVLFLVAMRGLAPAQQGRGGISGTVTDAQGAVVQGARVAVRNTATNAIFQTLSNDQGIYAAPGLPVGEYEVAAEAAGFKKSLRKGVTLLVDQKAKVDFVLEVGARSEE